MSAVWLKQRFVSEESLLPDTVSHYLSYYCLQFLQFLFGQPSDRYPVGSLFSITFFAVCGSLFCMLLIQSIQQSSDDPGSVSSSEGQPPFSRHGMFSVLLLILQTLLLPDSSLPLFTNQRKNNVYFGLYLLSGKSLIRYLTVYPFFLTASLF
jgi:hypothetical protein